MSCALQSRQLCSGRTVSNSLQSVQEVKETVTSCSVLFRLTKMFCPTRTLFYLHVRLFSSTRSGFWNASGGFLSLHIHLSIVHHAWGVSTPTAVRQKHRDVLLSLAPFVTWCKCARFPGCWPTILCIEHTSHQLRRQMRVLLNRYNLSVTK